ncbi:MAG: chromate transporter [Clostridiales bacterium]|nr:chromate transporter [Clostridiales bacterium]
MMVLRLFLSFFKVGLLGFGGGLAIVRLIFDSIQPFLDMSRETFANIVAISQITPGPLAVNTATYVGYEAAGIAGAAAATFGVVLPAFIIVSLVCRAIQKFKDSKVVNGALAGIRPATMGLIGAAAATLVKPSLAGAGRLGTGLLTKLGADAGSGILSVISGSPVDLISVIILIATVVLIAKYKKSPFLVLLIMGCLGAVLGV